MEDAIKSIKAHLYDRVVSPLFGAFLISWAIWNYRIIFVLLSSETIPYKFNYIDEYYSSIVHFLGFSLSKFCLVGVVSPLVSALLYIYLYPYFALPVYKFSLNRQKKLADTKNEIEGATLLTLEKSRKIIHDSKKMQISYDEKLHQAEEEIDALRRIISDQSYELAAIKNKNGDVSIPPSPKVVYSDGDINKLISEGLAVFSAGEEFCLFDVLSDEAWGSLNDSQRRKIERKFKADVVQGKYANILLGKKDGSGVQSYIISSKSYSSEDFQRIESVLRFAIKRPDTEFFTKDDIVAFSRFHSIEVQLALDEMLDLGFIDQDHINGLSGFRFLRPARDYIVKNMLTNT